MPHGSLVPPEYQAPTIDVDALMKDANGNDLFDLDIDAIKEEDKGWKKPGANMSDWFNYGMNEAAWRGYVMKQRRVREEESLERNPFIVSQSFLFFSLSLPAPPLTLSRTTEGIRLR